MLSLMSPLSLFQRNSMLLPGTEVIVLFFSSVWFFLHFLCLWGNSSILPLISSILLLSSVSIFMTSSLNSDKLLISASLSYFSEFFHGFDHVMSCL